MGNFFFLPRAIWIFMTSSVDHRVINLINSLQLIDGLGRARPSDGVGEVG